MSPLEIEHLDGLCVFRFHWNAENSGFHLETFREVTEAIQVAIRSPEVHAIAFFGSHKCFCLGSDVGSFLEQKNLDDLNTATREFFNVLATSQKPLIAAVNGQAMGLGMTMLPHFDIVIASPDSVFRAPFVEWGLVPEAGSSLLLPTILGRRMAFEVFCMGRVMNADEAMSLGLINAIVPEEDLVEYVEKCGEKLSSLPQKALQKTRSFIRPNCDQISQRLIEENDAFQDLLGSPKTKRRLSIMARASKRIWRTQSA